jgi:hypothetical protein
VLFDGGPNSRFRCWDGKNLDSPDHQAHVAYPTAGPATFDTDGGACPATHPVKVPQVMLEVCIREANSFVERSWQEEH